MARFYLPIEVSFPTSSSAPLHSFLPSFLLSFSLFRAPSFLPTLPPKSYTIHFPSHGAFIHADGNLNVRPQRAQAQGCTNPSTHASSLSRTTQHQPVRPSVPNAYKARTTPREMTPVERSGQESGGIRHVTDCFLCSAPWWKGYDASRLALRVLQLD